MTVSAVYEDLRKPTLPYALTIRHGRTDSISEVHRFPTMAEEARAMILARGLDSGPWPAHGRPKRASRRGG
jgi:hypothetical protein